MGSFSIRHAGVIKEIWFSLIRNAEWCSDLKYGICFEHGDDFITVTGGELEDLDEEVRDMLLQACGLDAT